MRHRFIALPTALLALAVAVGPASAAPFPTRIDLPGGWAPEGITAGRGFTAYVGSLATGAIAKVDLRTGTVDPSFAPGAMNRVTVGIDYEAGAHRIWAAGGNTHQVRVYDAATGALLQAYDFDSGFLNDVVVTNTAVYVTDSNIQQLIVIPLATGGGVPDPADAFTLPITGDFQYVTGFNANGIVAFAGWLIVPQSVTGALFAIDPDTGVSVELLPPGSVTAADGLELLGSTLYVVRNQLNRVEKFRIQGGRVTHLVTIMSADLSIPTTAAWAGGRLWAVNARFGTPVTPTTPYWITQLPG